MRERVHDLGRSVHGERPLARSAHGDRSLEHLRIGFIPLVDCAPLVVARDRGFAAAEGLAVDLVRETSWANVRDRVALGHFDAAHMLAPMAIAARLGPGHLHAPVIAPFVLDQGGNSIAVTASLLGEVPADAWGGICDPATSGRALAAVVAARARGGAPAPTFASVHPYSCHAYQLRHWAAAAGLDPDVDLRLVVVPPPYMVDAMIGGVVDGCCVGAPWSSLAVEAAVGRILLATPSIWPWVPEKVLGVRESFAEKRPEVLAALLRALDRACAWCEDPANRADLAALLARREIVGVAAAVIERSLSGGLVGAPGAAPVAVDGFLRFHGRSPHGPVNRPRTVDGLWFAAQMLRWGQVGDLAAAEAAARATFSSRHWDAAVGPAEADDESIVSFDGDVFRADGFAAWVAERTASRPRPR